QAINLLIFLPALLFLPGITLSNRIIMPLLAFFGVLIGLSPLLYWDSFQGFANLTNILDYLLIGQQRLYVPNSWRLFLFTYLPSYWAFVIGGFQIIALAFMGLLGVGAGVLAYKKAVSKEIVVLSVLFAILLIVNKFYKGER